MKKRSRIPRSVRARSFGAVACGFGHSGVAHTTKAGPARYRSLLELKYIQLLEKSPDVVSFKMEPFKVPYEIQLRGKTYKRTYTPDAFVTFADGHREIWEMKLSSQCAFPMNRAKFSAMEKYTRGSDVIFRVMTERNLRNA